MDTGGAFLEALVVGRGSVVLKGETDIVMRAGELGKVYYISRQMLRYA